ncbi:MAG: LysE family transporter [Candidatus Hodarchaeota archaeon]
MSFSLYFFIYLSSLLIGLSGAMMPGPVLAMTVQETVKYPKKNAWMVGFIVPTGHSILEIGLLFTIWLGASIIFSIPIVLLLIGVIGGSALILFGLIGLKSTNKANEEMKKVFDNIELGKSEPKEYKNKYMKALSEGFEKHPLLRPFLMGFILSATSAGWWAWWASIGMTAISIASMDIQIFQSFTVFIIFYLGHISSDYLWYMFIGGVVWASKRKINFKVFKVILIATNLFMIGMGAFFIISSF